MKAVLDFRKKHGRFTFHEVLFPSLTHEAGMSFLDWKKDPELKYHVANFRYRPEILSPEQGIVHPVKDLELANELNTAPAPEFLRLASANLTGFSILKEDYLFLSSFCKIHKLNKIIEFGPGDSTLAFRDAECTVTSYEHDYGWLEKARQSLGDDPQIDLQFCHRKEIPTDPEPADLTFIDGPPQREDEEMSRLPTCEWAMEKTGCFILHDAKREAEQAILQHFNDRGHTVWQIPTRKGLALVVDPARRSELLTTLETALSRWQPGEALAWRIFVQEEHRPIKTLSIGSNENKLPLLTDLFPHPKSDIHWIIQSEKTSPSASNTNLYQGEAVEILAWMIAGETYWESFDFILFTFAANSLELTSRFCQAWQLLRPGGMMGFVNFENNKEAVIPTNIAPLHALLKSMGDRIPIFLEGETIVLRKLF